MLADCAEAVASRLPEDSAVAQTLQRWPSGTEQMLVPVDPMSPPADRQTGGLPSSGMVFEGLSQADLLAIHHDASQGWVAQFACPLNCPHLLRSPRLLRNHIRDVLFVQCQLPVLSMSGIDWTGRSEQASENQLHRLACGKASNL